MSRGRSLSSREIVIPQSHGSACVTARYEEDDTPQRKCGTVVVRVRVTPAIAGGGAGDGRAWWWRWVVAVRAPRHLKGNSLLT